MKNRKLPDAGGFNLPIGCNRPHGLCLKTSYAHNSMKYNSVAFSPNSDFSAPVQTGPEAHPASYTMGTGVFPGLKRPGYVVDHPPHLATRLKEE